MKMTSNRPIYVFPETKLDKEMIEDILKKYLKLNSTMTLRKENGDYRFKAKK